MGCGRTAEGGRKKAGARVDEDVRVVVVADLVKWYFYSDGCAAMYAKLSSLFDKTEKERCGHTPILDFHKKLDEV